MAWEREHHHINLDENEHLIGLVEKGVPSRSGGPARWLIQIKIGDGAFEYKVGHNTLRIKLGGDFSIEPDGTLKDSEGNIFDPRAFEKEMIAQLNSHHKKLRAYGTKHNVPEMKAPVKGGNR